MQYILLFIALLVGATACTRTDALDEANVIVLLVDTLRRDRVGKSLSPCLDRLAAEGICFRGAVAPSSWTKPSVASLMTGLYPGQHGAVRYPWQPKTVGFHGMVPLDERHVTLAERMKAAGFRTAAFVTNPHIIPAYQFNQGFDEFTQPAGDAGELLDRALEWIESSSGRFFLYLHLIDPHQPYFPPEQYRERMAKGDPGEKAPYTRKGDPMEVALWLQQFVHWEPAHEGDSFRFDYERILSKLKENYPDISDELTAEGVRAKMFLDFSGEEDPRLLGRTEFLTSLYDAEVAFTNDAIEGFVQALKENGVLDKTVLVVTADHGEAFVEHEAWGHGINVHAEQVDIPLIFHVPLPEGPMKGEFTDPVSLVDVAPTLLDMIGAPAPRDMAGSSLWPLIREGRRGALGKRPVFSETTLITGDHVACVMQGRKMLRIERPNGKVQWLCYDIEQDPAELNPLDPASEPELRRAVERLIQNRTRQFVEKGGEEMNLTEEEIAEMKKFGYF
jgi:choline-sulfatase